MKKSTKVILFILAAILSSVLGAAFHFLGAIPLAIVAITLWNIPSPEKDETVAYDPEEYKPKKITLEKRAFTFTRSINLSQKIILSTAILLVGWIVCYKFAADLTDRYWTRHSIDIQDSWYVWVVFILFEAWIQNKIWNSNNEISFSIPFFKIKRSN